MNLNTNFSAQQSIRKNFTFGATNLKTTLYYENITSNLIDNISYSNKTFVNRLDDDNTIIGKEASQNLLESIKTIGLINPIYLLEQSKNNYIIISGWRRFLALKELYKEEINKIFYQKAIILKKETPLKILQHISIDENTQRKDLSILELSYMFNKLSNTKGIKVDECLKQFNIGKTKFHIIKKAIDFHPLIKDTILEDVGPVKANILNKILIKLLVLYPENEAHSLLFTYSSKFKEELDIILKNLEDNLNHQNDIFEIKKNNKITILKIKEDLTEEHHLKIKIFFKELLKK